VDDIWGYFGEGLEDIWQGLGEVCGGKIDCCLRVIQPI